MQRIEFDEFFIGEARERLLEAIRIGLGEDGPDLTSNAVFSVHSPMRAKIVAKEDSVLAGLPIMYLVLAETAVVEPGAWEFTPRVEEGQALEAGDVIAELSGGARLLLRAERVMLNFLTHLSGIATLTRRYVKALEGTGARLLDTRKTLPGLRYPEKYAVLVGGGCNHRKNLSELLMLKDNHIDAAGGVAEAVKLLRDSYGDPRIEVECRSVAEVRQAVEAGVFRIMLDNMLDKRGPEVMQEALDLIPAHIEIEVSGGITLENIASVGKLKAKRKPDFVSVGRLTHSAPASDFSMRIV
jgi:nicotinate-nucleotide pyrophosphorylase (carboxylating)